MNLLLLIYNFICSYTSEHQQLKVTLNQAGKELKHSCQLSQGDLFPISIMHPI